ncbi:hypothetical protein OK016_27630 [Vibrio chagasii]|nr:hypothetical protein [Vibrio chagasii]
MEHVTLTYTVREVSGIEKLAKMNLPRKIVKQVTSPSSMPALCSKFRCYLCNE